MISCLEGCKTRLMWRVEQSVTRASSLAMALYHAQQGVLLDIFAKKSCDWQWQSKPQPEPMSWAVTRGIEPMNGARGRQGFHAFRGLPIPKHQFKHAGNLKSRVGILSGMGGMGVPLMCRGVTGRAPKARALTHLLFLLD